MGRGHDNDDGNELGPRSATRGHAGSHRHRIHRNGLEPPSWKLGFDAIESDWVTIIKTVRGGGARDTGHLIEIRIPS